MEAATHKAADVRPPNTHHEKLSKLDEPDLRDTTGEVGTTSLVMYSDGPLHMAEQRQDDQLEPTYSSSVPIRDVVLKTCRKQWTIGRSGERGSWVSSLMARHDDDDDIPYTYQWYQKNEYTNVFQ